MSDLSHHYEALDRALKRIGIILIDDHGHIRSGKSAQCVALLRKILLLTSSVLAQQMLLRGCPSHAPDKRLVISAFDLVREKIKYSPSITVEQFFKEVGAYCSSKSLSHHHPPTILCCCCNLSLPFSQSINQSIRYPPETVRFSPHAFISPSSLLLTSLHFITGICSAQDLSLTEASDLRAGH